MTLTYRAAVLHAAKTPMTIETVTATPLKPSDVVVKIRAAGLCHTDLEVIEGGLRFPMPIVLGHEAAGVVEEVGPEARGVRKGDHVVLSWNPHCGHCFYCDRDAPILCETYLGEGPKARGFDGDSRAILGDGQSLQHLMYLGAFGEYCIVPDQQAIVVPKDIPFDRACLIGCGVMTGYGAVAHVAQVEPGSTVTVIGCGAVGLSAVQGARMAGAARIIAIDRQTQRLEVAAKLGATHTLVADDTLGALHLELTQGRGADYVFEAAGNPAGFRASVDLVRPGGQVVWLGKLPADADMSFRWGALMGEKRIVRSSYGAARPARDFPALAQAYLDGTLKLDEYVTSTIALEDVNDGLDRLAAGRDIRAVIEL